MNKTGVYVALIVTNAFTAKIAMDVGKEKGINELICGLMEGLLKLSESEKEPKREYPHYDHYTGYMHRDQSEE